MFHPLWRKLPLLLHAVIETAAAASFIGSPERQLPGAASDEATRLVLRSYGGLLLATAALGTLFAARPGFDDAARLVAACLGSYHAWPMFRAGARIRWGVGAKKGAATGSVLGGPGVHLVVHAVCFLGLIGTACLPIGTK